MNITELKQVVEGAGSNWIDFVDNYSKELGLVALGVEPDGFYETLTREIQGLDLSAFETAVDGAVVDVEEGQDYITQNELLKIEEHLDKLDVDVTKINFTLLGLTKCKPKYDKGRKTEATYSSDEEETDVVVKKKFKDMLDVNGELEGIEIDFEWLDKDGNVGKTKKEKKKFSLNEKGSQKRKRRERAIDILIEGANGTAAEPLVVAIFAHYQSEKDEYLTTGDSALEDAVNNETDPTILGYLGVVVTAEGETIKDRIIYNIT